MREQQHNPEGLARLSGLRDYRVAPDDPDPRGWDLVTPDGTRIGEIDDLVVDTSLMKVRFFEVRRDASHSRGPADDHLVFPAEAIELSEGDRQAVLKDERYLQTYERSGAAGAGTVTGAAHADRHRDRDVAAASSHAQFATHDRAADDAARVTRAEEELRVGAREVKRGEVMVNKTVETEHVSAPVQRRVDHVHIERRPVSADANTAPTITDEEVRVPIIEEQLVVEKRPVVKEELVITRTSSTRTEHVEADLRKERLDVHEDGATREGDRPRGRENRNG